MTIISLTLFFSVISFLYSLVGFGGGSSYLALLMISGVNYEVVPIIALLCNTIVVSSSSIRFFKNKLLRWDILIPLIIVSVPASYMGGITQISKLHFTLLIGGALFVAGFRMIFFKMSDIVKTIKYRSYIFSFMGLLIGFFSGLIGIGGGIFLSPILFYLKVAKPKEIASVSSVFILVNSIAGLIGQYQKIQSIDIQLDNFTPLFIVVFVGGQLGNYLCNYKISDKKLKLLSGVLVLIVSLKLLYGVL